MNSRELNPAPNARTARAPAGAALLLLCIGAFGGACSHQDPDKPLTDEQGQALVKSIRKHPPKPDDLTPAEKSYLTNYLATHK